MTSHEQRYRMVLPLGLLFALASIASTVVFIVYATEWNDNTQTNMADSTNASRDQQNRKTRVEYAYQATVLSLLAMIVFFNGYHLTKIRM